MKNQKLSLLTIVSACLLALFGCAPSDSGGSSSGSTLTGPITELQGIWVSGCIADSSFYFKSTSTINGRSGSQVDAYYTDSACTVRAFEISRTVTNINVGDGISFTNGNIGYRYTFNSQTVVITTLNDIMTQAFNEVDLCSFNWETDKSYEVSGTICGTTSYPVKNTTHYNIYQLSGNNLYVGEASTTVYPTSTESNPYVKQ